MSVVRTIAMETSNPVGDFTTWVSPHLPVMTSLAARLVTIPADRDDVVQEALTAAWRKRATFDAARGTPRAWLLAIVADQARKTWRRRRTAPLGEVGVAYVLLWDAVPCTVGNNAPPAPGAPVTPATATTCISVGLVNATTGQSLGSGSTNVPGG